MEKLSAYQISILRQVEKYEKGIPEKEIESAIGKKNIAAFDELFAKKYIEQEVLENRGFLEPPANTLLFLPDIDYGNFILSEKGERALVEDDYNREHNANKSSAAIYNYEMHGNNYVASGDIHITDSIIAETVNNASEIPEELKGELADLLTYLKDKSISTEDKNTRAGKFLTFVGKGFSEVVTAAVVGLVTAAITG